MARLKEPKISGTFGNVTVYRMWGYLYQRAKSSLSAERVKTDPAFKQTMRYAQLLGAAARVASKTYRLLNKKQKKRYPFQFLTGKAYKLLMKGRTTSMAEEFLLDGYAGIGSFIHSGFVKPVATATPVNNQLQSSLPSMGISYPPAGIESS